MGDKCTENDFFSLTTSCYVPPPPPCAYHAQVSADYVDPREAVLTAQAAAAAANGEPSANGSVLPPPEEAAAAAANAAAASAAAVSNAHGGPNLIVQADGTRKLAIEGSRSPEAHVLGVWNGLICPRRAAMATEKGEVLCFAVKDADMPCPHSDRPLLKSIFDIFVFNF